MNGGWKIILYRILESLESRMEDYWLVFVKGKDCCELWMEDGRLFCIAFWKLESLEKNASRMEDYCEGKGLLRIMNGGWKIVLYRILEIGKFGKECKNTNGRLLWLVFMKVKVRIMNGGWKIVLYRILEIGKFGKECKSNGRLLWLVFVKRKGCWIMAKRDVFKSSFSRFNGWFFVAILEEREWMNLERERKREKFFREDCYRYREIIRFKRMKGSAWLERCHCHSSTRFEFYILYFNFNLF